jgi:hypothetical protein
MVENGEKLRREMARRRKDEEQGSREEEKAGTSHSKREGYLGISIGLNIK